MSDGVVVTAYCSGSIKKGDNDRDKLVWTEDERSSVSKGANPNTVKFLRPEDTVPMLDDSKAMFGRDLYQIQFADFVIVDARERRGVGIGVEIFAAKVFGTPLVSVIPPNSHYHKDCLEYRGGVVEDYVHPHISVLSDSIVSTFEDAGKWIAGFLEEPLRVKSMKTVSDSVTRYKEHVFPDDDSMGKIHFEVEKSTNSRINNSVNV